MILIIKKKRLTIEQYNTYVQNIKEKINIEDPHKLSHFISSYSHNICYFKIHQNFKYILESE